MDCAAVAQWIEYWPPKPRVVGSIPASRTKFLRAPFGHLAHIQAPNVHGALGLCSVESDFSMKAPCINSIHD